jgi:hypothetical protein
MTIEQSFRDTKNPPLGQGLSVSRSRSAPRFEMLLMIEHLAAYLLRLIGESAQQAQMTLLFQSTCRSTRKEISVMTLAHRAITPVCSGLPFLLSGTLSYYCECRLKRLVSLFHFEGKHQHLSSFTLPFFCISAGDV